MRLIFIVPIYPKFSETFILQEMFQLQTLGVEGLIMAVKKGREKQQPLVKKINFKKLYFTSKVLRLFNLIKIFYLLIINFLKYRKEFLKIFFWFIKTRGIFFSNLRLFLKVILKLDEVKAYNPDLLVAHFGLGPTEAAIFIKFLLKVPLVTVLHTNDLFVGNNYLQQKLELADLVIVKSKFSQKYLREKLNVKTNKIEIVHLGGIDTNFFRPSRRKKRKKDSSGKTIVSIGRLVGKKGFKYLIEALFIVKKRGLDFVCYIVGNGPKKDFLLKKINNYQLQKKVKILPALPHNRRFLKILQRADIFVLPSIVASNGDRDILANSLLEAMACQLPVVTTKISSIKELIIDEKNGFLIQPQNSKALADCLEKVLAMKKRQLEKIGRKGRQTIVKNFNSQKEGRKFYKLLERVSK